MKKIISLITNNSDGYDEKHMKINLNSDSDLSLRKTLYNMVIVVRSIFHEGNNCYPQDFLDKCFCKL